jgi:carboxyl-terminal processing protease
VFGVGIFVELEGERPVVVQPIPDTPAFRAGLRPGDRILAVNNATTEGMSLPEVVSRIRGPAGTQVTLKLARDDRTFEVTLTRARIANVSVQADQNLPAALRRELLDNRVAYVRLLMFNETTASEFSKAVDAALARGARGLLLDLRNNGGGLLDVSIDVANRFIEAGRPIVHTVDRSGRRQTERATGGVKVGIPVVVLVNEFTASAAEILAGALKDNGAGTVVGQSTFGKGVIQTIITLPGSTGATLTSGKYLTPKGHDIHKKGVTPDVVAGKKHKGLTDAQVRAVESEQFARGLQVLKQAIARR